MGGIIHAVEDGSAMNARQVIDALTAGLDAQDNPYVGIQAVTPHGTYYFDVVAVECELGAQATLRLREVQS